MLLGSVATELDSFQAQEASVIEATLGTVQPFGSEHGSQGLSFCHLALWSLPSVKETTVRRIRPCVLVFHMSKGEALVLVS